ncbi:MAG TPA: hypothetical protein VGD02_04050 [Gemmatimonadaceae bacterium]|jgi:hypothetical protein
MIALAPVLQKVAAIAKPWAAFYGDSVAASVTVTFAHIAGLLFAGGVAIAADRATLRAFRGGDESRQRVLEDLGTTHWWVLVALSLTMVSGLLLALSDVKTFGTSLTFWTKMVLIILLLINGSVLQRTERQLRGSVFFDANSDSVRRGWSRLRVTAIISLALWTSITLAGVILVEAS